MNFKTRFKPLFSYGLFLCSIAAVPLFAQEPNSRPLYLEDIQAFIEQVDRLSKKVEEHSKQLEEIRGQLRERRESLKDGAAGAASADPLTRELEEKLRRLESQYEETQAEADRLAERISSSKGHAPHLLKETLPVD